jgi:hypothetical protein
MRWAGHVARIGAMRNAYIVFVRKSEEENTLGRYRNHKEIGWEDMNCIYMAQDRDQCGAVVNTVVSV